MYLFTLFIHIKCIYILHLIHFSIVIFALVCLCEDDARGKRTKNPKESALGDWSVLTVESPPGVIMVVRCGLLVQLQQPEGGGGGCCCCCCLGSVHSTRSVMLPLQAPTSHFGISGSAWVVEPCERVRRACWLCNVCISGLFTTQRPCTDTGDRTQYRWLWNKHWLCLLQPSDPPHVNGVGLDKIDFTPVFYSSVKFYLGQKKKTHQKNYVSTVRMLAVAWQVPPDKSTLLWIGSEHLNGGGLTLHATCRSVTPFKSSHHRQPTTSLICLRGNEASKV